MRLQQQSETTVNPVRRYDANDVREILARASELEQAEQEKLSAAQVEELGRELGLNPEMVRRALGEKERGKIATVAAPSRRSSYRTVKDVFLIGMTYTILLNFLLFFIVKNSIDISPLITAVLYYLPPFLIGRAYGRRRNSPLSGIIRQTSAVLFALGAIGVGFALATGHANLDEGDVFLIVLTTIAAGFAGVLGNVGINPEEENYRH